MFFPAKIHLFFFLFFLFFFFYYYFFYIIIIIFFFFYIYLLIIIIIFYFFYTGSEIYTHYLCYENMVRVFWIIFKNKAKIAPEST